MDTVEMLRGYVVEITTAIGTLDRFKTNHPDGLPLHQAAIVLAGLRESYELEILRLSQQCDCCEPSHHIKWHL
ncbi:MAG: hypothetical protein MN733_28875 [Nitrososphaera sp.]|nr:hypothetical protein [Nitrososphaera sp.]